MKKKFIYMAICLSAVLTGCSLDRFPLNGPSTGTFPASEEEALAGVLVSYKNLVAVFYCYSADFCTSVIHIVGAVNCYRAVCDRLWSDFNNC